jgi:hypothetical protein
LPLIIENALLTESREWILDSSGRRKERDERGFQWLIETSDGVPLEHSVFKPLDKKTFVSINSQQVWCEWSRAIHLIGKGWSDYGCDANRMMVNVQLKNVDNTAVARPYLEGVDIPEVLGWARYARF